MILDDKFIFVEENSNSNDVVTYSRKDIAERINDFVYDLEEDDKSYKEYLITDLFDDEKIITGIEKFYGTFIKIER